MIQHTKNSKDIGADTVSHTNGRSYGREPYNNSYKVDTQNQYRYSQMSQDTLQNEPYNFDLSFQIIMPLVNSLKQENIHFKEEKEMIEGDMKNLHQISNSLLEENKQLRKHYCERTQDIKKLVETITINSNQDYSDIEHQNHLYRQSNIFLVKKIEEKVRDNKQTEQSIIQKKNQLNSMTQQSIQNEEAVRNFEMKNKHLFMKCEQLKVRQESYNNQKVNESINENIEKITNIRNINKKNLFKAKSVQNKINCDKPHYEENYVSVSKQIGELKVEQKNLTEDSNYGQNKRLNLEKAYQQSNFKNKANYKKVEKLQRQKQQGEEEQIKMKIMIQQTKKNISKNQSEFKDSKKQKQNLLEQINKKKTTINKINSQIITQRENIQSAHKKKLDKLKASINQQLSKANEEIALKMNPEAATISNNISDSREEFAYLVQEIDELKGNIKKLDNPLKQIIRHQFLLKKMANKK